MNPDRSPRDQPLEVDITSDGRLLISIGIGTLCHAVQMGELLPQDSEIVSPDLFAADIRRALECEDGSGLTPVHRMLDQAALAAYEEGSHAIHG